MSSQIDSSKYSNLMEYTEPELYDLENTDFAPDGPFFLAFAQQLGGPVLELGCGTGRLTIPMARAGVEMTGLDVMPGMLAQARRKSPALPIHWVEADARSFQLDQRFQLIFDNAAAFVHVLTRTEHEAILARVREHLAPEGRFVLVNMFFRPTLMTDRDEHDWFAYPAPQRGEVRVSGTIRYDFVQQCYHEDAIRRWRNQADQEEIRYAPLARRIFFAPELEALLHYNGFEVVTCYGDWESGPLTDDSSLMIFVCKLRGS